MIERPILFSAPMVRALLAGTKTQTRRVVKLAPADLETLLHRVKNLSVCCPYGQPGHRLWVREAWDFLPDGTADVPNAAVIRYWAGGEWERRLVPDGFNPMIYGHKKVRPSMHMPRWASRITLEITGIRVERLQDISELDAISEGCSLECMSPTGDDSGSAIYGPNGYRALWEYLYGSGSFDLDPWVWVVEFKRIEARA